MTGQPTLPRSPSGTVRIRKADWETPNALFASVDAELRFTLDACALPHNTKCERFYSPEDDAPSQPWHGRVWCNPEFSQVREFVTKAVGEIDAGRAELVCLLDSGEDGHPVGAGSDAACRRGRLLAGRVRFVGAAEPCPFPVMLTILRRPLRWSCADPKVSFTIPTRHRPGIHWTILKVVRDAEA